MDIWRFYVHQLYIEVPTSYFFQPLNHLKPDNFKSVSVITIVDSESWPYITYKNSSAPWRLIFSHRYITTHYGPIRKYGYCEIHQFFIEVPTSYFFQSWNHIKPDKFKSVSVITILDSDSCSYITYKNSSAPWRLIFSTRHIVIRLHQNVSL